MSVVIAFIVVFQIITAVVQFDTSYSLLFLSSVDAMLLTTESVLVIVYVVVLLTIMLYAGDAANRQSVVHITALSDQRLDMLSDFESSDYTSDDMNHLSVRMQSLESVNFSLVNQDRLYPIKLLGMRADKTLLTAVASVFISIASIVLKLRTDASAKGM